MALAIYIMHGRGSSKEMRLQLQPDKAKVMLCIIRQQKVLCTLFITNKMAFKVGVLYMRRIA